MIFKEALKTLAKLNINIPAVEKRIDAKKKAGNSVTATLLNK